MIVLAVIALVTAVACLALPNRPPMALLTTNLISSWALALWVVVARVTA
jgi:hypothetical protein